MVEPLVLVPGMMADARAFLPQIVELGWKTAVHIAPPLRGGTVAEMAQDALATAPGVFALCGHGLGGIVAMEIVRSAPERVTRLALMDTSCQSELPQVAAAREPRIVAARSGRFPEALLDEIRLEHLADSSLREGILDAVLEMAADLGAELFVRQSKAMQRRPDQQGALRRIRTPTLILCGEADPVFPVRRHEFMAHLMPNARLEVIKNAGHLPALEAPNAVSDRLTDWLSWPPSSVPPVLRAPSGR